MSHDLRSASSLEAGFPRLSPWLSCPRPNPEARLRLFCFPYAGGGASIFRTWPEALPSFIEVYAIQPPGRENRFIEAPLDTLALLVEALLPVLRGYLNKTFAFFGHSLGALIAFEVACALRTGQWPVPVELFVSGRSAPQVPRRSAAIHPLPDKPFIEALRRLGGTPEAVLEHAELMQLLLPALRGDFAVSETYVYGEREPLDCSLSVFGGRDDLQVNPEDLAAWQLQTRGAFQTRLFAGGHFFLHSERDELLAALTADLLRLERDGTL